MGCLSNTLSFYKSSEKDIPKIPFVIGLTSLSVLCIGLFIDIFSSGI